MNGTPSWRRLVVLLTAVLTITACTRGGGDDPNADGAADVWDDGRVTFAYPRGWEVVEEGGPDEYLVRLEPPGARDEQADLPTGTIVVLWPFVTRDSLDASLNIHGVSDDDPAIEDLDERDTEVEGATAAVRQDYRVTDATGRGDPAGYHTLHAMGEVGRTVFVMVAAPEDSEVELDEVASLVFEDLELRESWG
jgi:hypothetical protein